MWVAEYCDRSTKLIFSMYTYQSSTSCTPDSEGDGGDAGALVLLGALRCRLDCFTCTSKANFRVLLGAKVRFAAMSSPEEDAFPLSS